MQYLQQTSMSECDVQNLTIFKNSDSCHSIRTFAVHVQWIKIFTGQCSICVFLSHDQYRYICTGGKQWRFLLYASKQRSWKQWGIYTDGIFDNCITFDYMINKKLFSKNDIPIKVSVPHWEANIM